MANVQGYLPKIFLEICCIEQLWRYAAWRPTKLLKVKLLRPFVEVVCNYVSFFIGFLRFEKENMQTFVATGCMDKTQRQIKGFTLIMNYFFRMLFMLAGTRSNRIYRAGEYYYTLIDKTL